MNNILEAHLVNYSALKFNKPTNNHFDYSVYSISRAPERNYPFMLKAPINMNLWV